MALGTNYRGWHVSKGDATGDQLVAVLPDGYRVLHIASAADAGTDWNVAAPSHPTVYIHSETTPATDYISFDHDATDGTINVASGNLKLAIDGTDEITVSSTALTVTSNNVVISAGNLDVTNAALGATDIGVPVFVTVSAPNNQSGMSGYFDATINGTTAGHSYGLGSWINTGATSPVLAAGHIIVPFEGGVFTGEAQTNARVVFGGQHQAILNGAPASLHAWRLNTTQTITALIAAANAGSVGYAASVATSSTKVGDVPLFDVVGTGVVYVRLYDAAG